jgi:NAD(P)-dependent dehydrogenase (short-subunit alcohol dehydrogenase family)
MKTTGNTIFIPGATSGIGLGLAQRFQALGNKVIIGGRRQSLLDNVVAGHPGIEAIAIDTSDGASIRNAAEAVKSKFPDTNILMPLIKDRIAKLNLAPLGPLPILIGGGGEKVTLRLVARYAQMWNGFGTPEELKAKNAIIDEWCKVEGTDPTKIERTTLTNIGPDLDLDAFREAGIQHLIVGLSHPFDLSAVEEVLGRARS